MPHSQRFQQLAADAKTRITKTAGELASKYLADAQYSLGQVADLLGFVDQSNFFRACKRWFGVPPGQHRQRLDKDSVTS